MIVEYLAYSGRIVWTEVDAIDEEDAVSKAFYEDSLFNSDDNIFKIIQVY